jgi:hypothetical protein
MAYKKPTDAFCGKVNILTKKALGFFYRYGGTIGSES